MEAKGFNQENTAGDAPSLCVCRCCGRLLPPDQFYLRRRGGMPEHRCKDCHRRAMRLRRKLGWEHRIRTVHRVGYCLEAEEPVGQGEA